MNVQDYITSGILEQYATGAVSAQEKQEVECMSHIYPEIKEELQRLQYAIEQYTLSQAITPPAHLKSKILDAIEALEKDKIQHESPQSEPLVEAKIVPLNPNTGNASLYKYATAASVLLCIILSALFFTRKNSLEAQLTTLEKDNASNKAAITLLTENISIYQNPSYKKIILKGIKEKSPESVVTVYWNKENNEVFLDANRLPVPAAQKQYQLWAIKDGKPVDMGMLPLGDKADRLVKMNNIDNAQAFAITLEKEGGVPSPTLTEMYVMGNI